jgi:DNA polymerase III subunit delta
MLLVTGPEELLLRRRAEEALDELRADLGEVEVTDLRASELGESGLPDLRTGSLFGTPRAVLLREAQDLPADASRALLDMLDGAPPEATVILLATRTGRIQKLAKRIKDLGGRIDIKPPPDWDQRRWANLIGQEFARHDRTADQSAIDAILEHAGTDVGVIAGQFAQAVAAAPSGRVTAEHVEAVVVGHGNRGSFAVADAMCYRKPGEAVTLLRGVLEAGDDPVMVLGALAYRLRSLVAVAGNLDPKTVGLNISAGQARRLQAVRRNFGPGELTGAYAELAAADREIKGGELPAEFVIERAVVSIATRT